MKMKFSVAVESTKLNELLEAATPEYRKKVNGEQYIHSHKLTGTWIACFAKSIESYEQNELALKGTNGRVYFSAKRNGTAFLSGTAVCVANKTCECKYLVSILFFCLNFLIFYFSLFSNKISNSIVLFFFIKKLKS